jgi:hypothetical protein
MPLLAVDDYSTMTRTIRNLLKQIATEDVDEESKIENVIAARMAGVNNRNDCLDPGAIKVSRCPPQRPWSRSRLPCQSRRRQS